MDWRTNLHGVAGRFRKSLDAEGAQHSFGVIVFSLFLRALRGRLYVLHRVNLVCCHLRMHMKTLNIDAAV